MGQVTPGTGGSNPLSRRIEKIERFLSGLSRIRIRAQNAVGAPYVYPVLAGTGIPDGRQYKPFSFALDRHESGAMCYFGSLIVNVTTSNISAIQGMSSVTDIEITQYAIDEPDTFQPANLMVVENWSYKPTKLNSFGDVYLKWQCDGNATVDPASVTVLVASSPATVPIPLWSTGDANPPSGTFTYYKKIGTVPKEGPVTQILASDFYWNIGIVRGGYAP